MRKDPASQLGRVSNHLDWVVGTSASCKALDRKISQLRPLKLAYKNFSLPSPGQDKEKCRASRSVPPCTQVGEDDAEVPGEVCLMARATVTRHHKWGGSVQQKCSLSPPWRLGVCRQGLGRAGSSRRP